MMKYAFLFFVLLNQMSWAQNLKDVKGRKQGNWSKTYPKSNVLQYKGQFQDDIPVGTFTYYYEDGKVKAVIKHGPKAMRSEAYFYHPNTKLMTFGIYRSQKKDSTWINLNEDGLLTFMEEYKNDQLHGKRTRYFLPERENEKQRVSAVENYVNGKLHGEYVEYLITGTIIQKGIYKDGMKVGIWESFHQNGQKMAIERYKNGVLHGWCYFFDIKGVETSKSYFFEGKRLEGKALNAKLNELKQKGIDPNQ